MEKLIDDIALYFLGYHEQRRFDPTIPDRSKDYAKKAILRVGKAILSGDCADLDKLLGVVGRLEQEPRTTFYSRGVERSLQGWIRNRFKQGARTFIAVRRAK